MSIENSTCTRKPERVRAAIAYLDLAQHGADEHIEAGVADRILDPAPKAPSVTPGQNADLSLRRPNCSASRACWHFHAGSKRTLTPARPNGVRANRFVDDPRQQSMALSVPKESETLGAHNGLRPRFGRKLDEYPLDLSFQCFRRRAERSGDLLVGLALCNEFNHRVFARRQRLLCHPFCRLAFPSAIPGSRGQVIIVAIDQYVKAALQSTVLINRALSHRWPQER
jgi:hypothetical protein